jgi:hypothetical protein
MKIIQAVAALPALAALAATAGLYDQPWAEAQAGDASPNRKEAPAAVTQIDGKTKRDLPVEPGRHKVTLHFESARGTFRPEYKEVEIDFAPCTRYRFVAHYENPTGPDWTARSYTEPIGECRRKFMKDPPAEKSPK